MTVPQKSAEGKLGHAVGEDIEALHKPKGGETARPAGNGDRRPEQKGVASKSRGLGNRPTAEKPIAWPSAFQAE